MVNFHQTMPISSSFLVSSQGRGDLSPYSRHELYVHNPCQSVPPLFLQKRGVRSMFTVLWQCVPPALFISDVHVELMRSMFTANISLFLLDFIYLFMKFFIGILISMLYYCLSFGAT